MLTDTTATIIAGLLSGWLLGGLGNLAADLLPAWGRETWRLPARPDLVRSWLLIGSTARRNLWLMLMTVAVCGWMGWHFAGEWPLLGIVWLYAGFLLTVLVIDLEHRRVLNVMVVPGAIVALLFSLFPGQPTPLMALAGGALGLGSFLLLAIVGRGALGMGDVKLAGLIGLMIGYPNVIYALIMGVVLGGVAALYLIIIRRAGRKSTMAYAPYLAIGALYAIWMFLGR